MLRMLPTGTLALESDSPHLAPRIGWVNSPMRIWAQAERIAEICNVPVTTLLECSNRALRQFYGLWVLELDWTVLICGMKGVWMKDFYTVVIQWSWSRMGPRGRAVPQAQLFFVWGQPQHRLHCFRRKRGRMWCTEDEAPVEGMGLSGCPVHAQECDMESCGSLNWEALSQAGIVGVDGRDWHHRVLAKGLCLPGVNRRCWGRQWL